LLLIPDNSTDDSHAARRMRLYYTAGDGQDLSLLWPVMLTKVIGVRL